MFVGRRDDNAIYGLWTVRQYDGQEELPDDDSEVVAFRQVQADRMPGPHNALLVRRADELSKSDDLKDQVESLKIRLQLLGG